MIERVRQMVIKEFIQALRDKRMRMFIFLVPIIQLLAFGYAVTMDVNNIGTAVLDLDNSPESRELVRRLESSGYFKMNYYPATPRELGELLDRGRIVCGLQIDPGFSKEVKKGEPARVQVLLDGTDSNSTMVVMSYATRIIATYGRGLGGSPVSATFVPLRVETRAWYNPDLRSRNYNVPGVIALMIMLICLTLTSMSVVKEREVGTIEQLMVTPLSSLELILGKTLPFAAIGFFDMCLVTGVAVFWFEIPIRGSLGLLFLATTVYLLSVLAVGLFISTISKTQQQALMATFLFFAPAILLSGFMFPIENMPAVFQYATYLNPLRYFLVIVRGLFLKGSGFAMLWPQMAALLALGLTLITLSSMRFKKRLR